MAFKMLGLLFPLRIVQAVFAVIGLGLSAYGEFEVLQILTLFANFTPLLSRELVQHRNSHSITNSNQLLDLYYCVGSRRMRLPRACATISSYQATFVHPVSNLLHQPPILTIVIVTHPYAHLAFEIVTTIFFFAGFVALSVFLAKLLFCRGSVCAAARASAVFGAFSFVTWAVSAAVLGFEMFKGGFRAAQANNAKMDAMAETSPA